MKKMSEQRKTTIYHIVECLAQALMLLTVLLVAGRSGLGGAATWVTLVVCLALTAALKVLVLRRVRQNVYWYRSILDTIPFMMHATDMDMNWVFLNKATADFLGLDPDEVMGMHCSNWKAEICNTERCSAACLRAGNPTTFFEQNGLDLRVDTHWLHDKAGGRIGYVEVVQDISSMVAIQREQQTLIDRVRDLHDSLVSAATEIDGGSQVLAQGSSEQASAIEELSRAIAEVKQENQQNTEKTLAAAQLAVDIRQDVEQSGKQMRELTGAVEKINASSQAISKVIKTIDDIAFQTNILALNASVEAARAGAHGRGFAVVAGEVRRLAERCAEAAKDTGALIQDSIEKAQLGATISQDAALSLDQIIESIQHSSEVFHDIAESSRRQNDAILQIDEGIDSVSQVIQQNNDAAQNSAGVSRNMSRQTTVLQNLLQQKFQDEATPDAPETRMAVNL